MKYTTLFLFFLLSLYCQGQSYIRYNHLGYAPQLPKRVVVMSNSDQQGKKWSISDSDNKVVLSGTIDERRTEKGAHTSHAYNHEISFSDLRAEGKYTLTVTDCSPVQFNIKKDPYSFIVSDILRYLRVQRSGDKDCLDHLPSHYGDSSCAVFSKGGDSNESWKLNTKAPKVNMLGGWYDAGDYIKFTLTIAYTSYQLLHAYTLNPTLFTEKKYSKSKYNDLLDEAKFGLDYLSKTMADSNYFIIQVGGAEDHQQGDRLPNKDELNGKRNAYADFSPTQMGYTAAALALGAQVFDSINNPELHLKYKTQALKIYHKALQHHTPSWVKQGWESFYGDEKYEDNMQLAAFELYKLTGNKSYLTQAREFASKAKQAWWYSWGDAHILAHNRLFPYFAQSGSYALSDLIVFEGTAKQENNIWGVPHDYTWASLYSMLGVANNMLLYGINKQTDKYNKYAYHVLDYTLGLNNWGIAMVCSKDIPKSVKNIYSQVYKLQPQLYATGAVAEGPGDRKTHEELKQYFNIPSNNPFEEFNGESVVFYDLNTNFQTMETTIVGLSEALLFFTLISGQ